MMRMRMMMTRMMTRMRMLMMVINIMIIMQMLVMIKIRTAMWTVMRVRVSSAAAECADVKMMSSNVSDTFEAEGFALQRQVNRYCSRIVDAHACFSPS